MSDISESLTDAHREFIRKQKVFFVASAPRKGRINLSPKGGDTFRILDRSTAAYLDFTGSGNETAAHLLESGRITVMFCGFSGEPGILRIYGKGRTVLMDAPEWPE